MYDPDTYRRYQAPDNVIPPSIGLVKYELYTLMFQSVALFSLWVVSNSEDWLVKMSPNLDGQVQGCMHGTLQNLFEDSQTRFNDQLESLKTEWLLSQSSGYSQESRLKRRSLFRMGANSANQSVFNSSAFLAFVGNPRDLSAPTFNRIQLGLNYGCMQSRNSELEMAIENPAFLNKYNPLHIFQSNFTKIEKESDDFRYGNHTDSLPFYISIIPGIGGVSWMMCSKCATHNYDIYSASQDIIMWSTIVLAISMTFLIVSAISAKKFHDSHGLPKVTAFLGSFIQIGATLMLLMAIIFLIVIQADCQCKWQFSMWVAAVSTLSTFIPTTLIIAVVLRYRKISYEGM